MSGFTYQQARDYLNVIIRSGIKYDLHNIRRLLSLLDHPQRNFHVVSVAGTNGKGSTAAFLESILTESGYRVGLNTSPHLVSPRERLRICRTISNREDFASAVSEVATKTRENWQDEDPYRPTFFETMTSASLIHFRNNKVDIAIMEAGLGGRLDASNALDPILTIITRIGLDHPKTLGNTLKKIAFEKFGLARAGKPLVVARQRKHVLKHLRELSAFRGVFLQPASDDWRTENGKHVLRTEKAEYLFDSFGIPGSYQRENVASAVRTSELLRGYGFEISDKAITEGVAKAFWPGRMELKNSEPRMLLDGSHNTDGINNLVRTLARVPAKKRILIYAKVGERSPKTTFSKLAPLADHILLPPLTVGRAVAPEDLKAIISKLIPAPEMKKVIVCHSMAEAWKKARELYNTGDLMVIAGSLYLVGQFKAEIGDTLDES